MSISAAPRARPSARARLLFLLVVAVVLVVLLEAGTRTVEWLREARLQHRWSQLQGSDVAEAGSRATLGQIIRPSADPDVIYELIPNLDVTFLRKPVRTNASGFRGPDYPGPKRDGVVRIVGLGDSVMFGWGVGEGDTYLESLAARLEDAVPQLDWEVINTAVPGYNTAMEVAVLEAKGLAYDPDLVIINFVGNDFELPNFIPIEQDYLSVRRSFLWELITARLRPAKQVSEQEWRQVFVDAPRPKDRIEWRPDHVPPRYRNQVGREGYRRAMRRLAALRDEHGFLLVILGHPGVYDIVEEMSAELDIPIITTYEHFLTGIQHNHLSGLRDPSLIVAPNDSHPAARGHHWIAQLLANKLRENGVLRELVMRRAPPDVLRELGLSAEPRAGS